MTSERLSDDAAALLDDQVDALWPDYVELLQDLVRIASTAGNERPAQELLAARARAIGLRTDLWDVDSIALSQHPDFASADSSLDPRPNLTAVLPGVGNGRSLAISGHV